MNTNNENKFENTNAKMGQTNPLLAPLNEAQRSVVRHHTGPALVVAGAGSGKTRTVVHRIAYLMEEHGVYPSEILAVTFTNKAAGEMKNRVVELVGPQAEQIWVSTFHSAGVRILRAHYEAANLKPGFVIYDDGDQLDVLKQVLESIPGASETNPRYLRSVIDRAKSHLWTPDGLAQNSDDWVAGLPRDVAVEGYRKYEQLMARANAIDFGDLLVKTVKLFKEHPDVLDKVQRRAVFVHVDEYQDTNRAQYEFSALLSEKYRNLLVVGDADQSIYKFRGADIQNILDFQSDYPEAVLYRLEENYRSRPEILLVANKLIEHNSERLEKVLRPTRDTGEPVNLYRAPDHKAEADFVANRIDQLRADGTKLNDIAILYRTNAQSRSLEERFMRSDIPLKIVGGVSFYERQEIKDILSYARVAVNPSDDLGLKRAIKRPKRGVGEASLAKLEAWSEKNRVPLLSALVNAETILERGADKAKEFGSLILELADYALEHTAAEFLKLTIDVTGYRDMLNTEMKTGSKFEAEARLENIAELVNAAEDWDAEHKGSIEAYLDDAALLASVDDARTKRDKSIEDAVTMMTMHNAKGLEFKEVFVVGMEEGLLPHRSSVIEPGGIEEERRLFYVAVTRAMDRLTITYADSRQVYGKTMPSEASRFLEDVPQELLQPVDLFFQPTAAETTKRYSPTVRINIPNSMTASNAGDSNMVLKGGEVVKHPKFGRGKVLGLTGQAERQEAMIVFENGVGAKKLLVKYANLSLE